MSLQTIEHFITGLVNTSHTNSYGYDFYFYDTEQMLPFVSIAASDNEHDNVSNLDREGVFRINIGISKDSFNQLFQKPGKEWNYTMLNQIMPHPHYAAQYFICVLNPEGETLIRTISLIEEAYLLAKKRHEKKQNRGTKA